ncbi:phosphoribosyltransferase [Shewanella algae]|uniref:phosphoribosyltransferase n=1 Tax=Shewanella algae TaxID=38313 RepID=UPI002035358F|nr:phosphoribosyltransferase [Shewanella algae]MCM2529701.1 phosphoribosyltransferase [Shewanella algae]
MAAKLKGVILSIEDVLLNKGSVNENVFMEVRKLINFFKLRNVTPVLLANTKWTITDTNGTVKCLFGEIKKHIPEIVIFSSHLDSSIPKKPTAASTSYVLRKMQWKANEVLYIGSTDNDMRTAVNGKILFLRASWYNNNSNYGFNFSEPKQIARFIDSLCLREHFWSHEIIDGDFEFYALAPFSTYKVEFKRYSEDAREAAKFGRGHPDFWLSAIVTSMYFTGIQERIDFITAYPGHQAGVGNDKMNDDLMTFGKCFRKGYLHDLIERHTTALKSQTARQTGQKISHKNQLNTIRLNRLPTKNNNSKYKTPPLRNGKKVLVVDDICTRGYSLETARKYIEKTGAKTILVAWLKTINTDIETLGHLGQFDPYQNNTFKNVIHGKTYSYQKYLVDPKASEELSDQFEFFKNWDWPAGV